MWKLLAYVVSRPRVAEALIWRAKRTPYQHIDGYMNRWWLWNGYTGSISNGGVDSRSWIMRNVFPAIRIHHILRADDARDLHDHPWNARTIILNGWYKERREGDEKFTRSAGDTAKLRYGEYHSIDEVSPGGVWTLFFAGKDRGMWGFLVDGKKVPWREYT